MSKKNKLLKNLYKDVYCRLKASNLSGVGVFAIKDIPPKTDPFKKCNMEKYSQYYILISRANLEEIELDTEVMKMIQDFCHEDRNTFPIPINGLNSLDISFYLNHSVHPNVDIVNEDDEYYSFKTNREIKKGEELLINYKIYD